ncbi:DUF4288 domain-containing protein [Bdellovibrio bacteriovorus]|uniref:DUF4288 domain-containing protein n=1 Tax=Bdellovibrio bacteriovorus TaxID=959 RepID=A0A1Z3N9Y0_BDEBC|nr:DUF4288 domain-containing protein [Bdellovibrio bacteriovorus]ASD64231.1 hypothetical protein B9G79_11965 [Bdellovibrio bacteriovorus]
MKNKKWFAVKTLYVTRAVGKSSAKGKQAFAELLEERVVLFQAANANAAVKAAEKDAKEYSQYTYTNFEGQAVRTEYLKACDVFELYETLESGVELFASTEVLTKKVSSKELIARRLGVLETKNTIKMRKRFMSKELGSYV